MVDDAVVLVNAVVPGECRGRPYPPAADPVQLHERVEGVTVAVYGRPVDSGEAAGLAGVAQQLRRVFDAVATGDADSAATQINAMITEYEARPTLARGDDGSWHLHSHAPDAPFVAGVGAAAAVGLAYVLGSEHADRIGICSADGCDRVYLDTSRNGTKRFCGTACQNRTKTSTFRARQAASDAESTIGDRGAAPN
ncbi:CGNR zinc finger domain-containing protein [Nocardia sp. NEAU-G5]|uniref:CGNR zinc finger domain-containing protein n=1 Tax=Nocardia albiluteola TaxID=2842303 RepID=A0ABS6B6D0_9NOCA|nr:CGNR zinc finger domain-containing protein [Nocardia albiluteola]MBU3065882.1 CGNR zinc finger domain-containing protein [Nocardia albiluteola]